MRYTILIICLFIINCQAIDGGDLKEALGGIEVTREGDTTNVYNGDDSSSDDDSSDDDSNDEVVDKDVDNNTEVVDNEEETDDNEVVVDEVLTGLSLVAGDTLSVGYSSSTVAEHPDRTFIGTYTKGSTNLDFCPDFDDNLLLYAYRSYWLFPGPVVNWKYFYDIENSDTYLTTGDSNVTADGFDVTFLYADDTELDCSCDFGGGGNYGSLMANPTNHSNELDCDCTYDSTNCEINYEI